MSDIPKLQVGILQGLHPNHVEWLRQSTDSINARFALVLDTQTANKVYGGPSGGGAAVPGFRSLVAADLPPITASLLPIQSYHASFTGTQVTNQVALTVTNAGMYLLNTYVQWTTVGIGGGLSYTQTWNDGTASHVDSTLAVAAGNNDPSRVTQFAKLGASTNITFTTTQSANPTFGTYEVYVTILQIG